MKIAQYSLNKIGLEVQALLQVNGWTDMTKLTSTFQKARNKNINRELPRAFVNPRQPSDFEFLSNIIYN
jgi:hypothetical protein